MTRPEVVLFNPTGDMMKVKQLSHELVREVQAFLARTEASNLLKVGSICSQVNKDIWLVTCNDKERIRKIDPNNKKGILSYQIAAKVSSDGRKPLILQTKYRYADPEDEVDVDLDLEIMRILHNARRSYKTKRPIGDYLRSRISRIEANFQERLSDQVDIETEWRQKVLDAKALPSAELFQKAQSASSEPKKVRVTAEVFVRDPHVTAYVLQRADGICEMCGEPGIALTLEAYGS